MSRREIRLRPLERPRARVVDRVRLLRTARAGTQLDRQVVRLPGEALARRIAEELVEAHHLARAPGGRAGCAAIRGSAPAALVADLEQSAEAALQRASSSAAASASIAGSSTAAQRSGAHCLRRVASSARGIQVVRRGEQLRTGRVGQARSRAVCSRRRSGVTIGAQGYTQ